VAELNLAFDVRLNRAGCEFRTVLLTRGDDRPWMLSERAANYVDGPPSRFFTCSYPDYGTGDPCD
jgi:hypothetical protein